MGPEAAILAWLNLGGVDRTPHSFTVQVETHKPLLSITSTTFRSLLFCLLRLPADGFERGG